MILLISFSFKTSLSKASSLSFFKRFYPGNLPSIVEITRGFRSFYVLDLLPKQYDPILKTAGLIRYNPEKTRQLLIYWRNHNPELACHIHAQYLPHKTSSSPIKISGGNYDVNPITLQVVQYLSMINPKNEVLNDFYLDKLISYKVSCDDDYILNMLYKFENHEPISDAEITYIITLLERKSVDKTEITFSVHEQKLLTFLTNLKDTTLSQKEETLKLESRDDFEFRQIYQNRPEPTTQGQKAIKEFLSMKKTVKCITIEDFNNELLRKKKSKEILENHFNELDEKQLLEITRREGLLVNNDAGFQNHFPYLEGQGLKASKDVYRNKTMTFTENDRISVEIQNHIISCIEKKEYKICVGVNKTSDVLFLDNITLHPCFIVSHPHNDNELLIVGYCTSANQPSNFLLDKIQKDFPIAETTDKSKKPQFEQENIRHASDPLNKREIKAQYFHFTKTIIIVSKEDYLENTLATEYIAKGRNSEFEPVHNKLVEYHKKFLEIIGEQYFEYATGFDKSILREIALRFMDNQIKLLMNGQNELNNHLKLLTPDKRKKKLEDLEVIKKNYLLKEEILVKEKLLGAQYPQLKGIIKMVKLLEEKKRFFKEDQEKKKRAEKTRIKMLEYEERQKIKAAAEENKIGENYHYKRIEAAKNQPSNPNCLRITYPKNET